VLVGKTIDVEEEDFTLKSLIDLDVIQFQEEICAISVQATQEDNLRRQLKDLEEPWDRLNFVIE